MSSERRAPVRAGAGRRRARSAVGALALLASGCIGDDPIAVDARTRIFGLLGGLEVGEALTLEGSQATEIALPGNASGADYVIVPFMGSDADAVVTVGIQGAALLDAVGPPARSTDGSAVFRRPAFSAEASTARFHERLRLREIRELEPGLRSMDRSLARRAADLRAGGPSRAAAAVPAVGDVLSLRTLNDASPDLCENPLQRSGRVAAVSERAIMVSDMASPVELSDADLAAIAAEFDALVHPVDVQSFGEPTDLDLNERVIIFFTPVVNDVGAAGFFFAGDLFAQSSCAASNEAEIVYILSPDPTGQTALQVPYEAVATLAADIIAHEVQHLINASRRIYVNDAAELETVWMNEGLSHIAEELVFYAATSFGPGENLNLQDLQSVADEANRFLLGNFFFYAGYAESPTDATLTGSDNDATRGAAWAFLRYVADREGRPDEEIFHDLVNSTTSGLENLDQVLETGDALDLMQAWTASVFSDDHVDGVPDFLTQPSWNFRSALPAIMDDGLFPLTLEVLQPSAGRLDVVMNGGGSAFFQLRVGPSATGEVQIDLVGSPAALRVTVIRSR